MLLSDEEEAGLPQDFDSLQGKEIVVVSRNPDISQMYELLLTLSGVKVYHHDTPPIMCELTTTHAVVYIISYGSDTEYQEVAGLVNNAVGFPVVALSVLNPRNLDHRFHELNRCGLQILDSAKAAKTLRPVLVKEVMCVEASIGIEP